MSKETCPSRDAHWVYNRVTRRWDLQCSHCLARFNRIAHQVTTESIPEHETTG